VLALVVVAVDFIHPLTASSPSARAVLETCVVGAAVAAAASFWTVGGQRGLLLCAGLTILGTVEFVSTLVPNILGLHTVTAVSGGPLFGTICAAGCLIEAARTPADRRIARARASARVTVAVSVLTALACEAAAVLLRGEVAPAHAGLSQLITDHPDNILLVAVGAALALRAAVLFVTSDDSGGLPISGVSSLALAAGAILMAATCVDWLTLGSVRPDLAAPATVLRLLAVGTLVFAARNLLSERRRLGAAVAIERERRRLARDLHDGLCQDLAFIASYGSSFADEDGEEHPMSVAARRALAVSRGTLAELAAPGAATIEGALTQVAEELSERYMLRIEVQTDNADVRGDERDALVRIAREAIVNAAKHGGARHVVVSLASNGTRRVLRVVDDGTGIGAHDGGAEGFGMASMRERAHEVGGQLDAAPGARGGTRLEVVLT
jgi:signal transduction histidine kinase